jgi:sodium-dependent dicarboxylate transporter 2/3/5
VIAKLMQDRGLVAEDVDPLRLRVGATLMLMLAYGASVGGLLTPVGSPPNLIGRGRIEEATGERISFAQWVAVAVPICLLMFVALVVVLLLHNKPEIRRSVSCCRCRRRRTPSSTGTAPCRSPQ